MQFSGRCLPRMLQVFNPQHWNHKIQINIWGDLFSCPSIPFNNFYLSLTILYLKLLSLNFWNRLCMKMQHKHSHTHTAYSRQMLPRQHGRLGASFHAQGNGRQVLELDLSARETLTFLHSPGFSRGCGCHLEAAQALQATHSAALARESDQQAAK